jgi:hypothetical protein
LLLLIFVICVIELRLIAELEMMFCDAGVVGPLFLISVRNTSTTDSNNKSKSTVAADDVVVGGGGAGGGGAARDDDKDDDDDDDANVLIFELLVDGCAS